MTLPQVEAELSSYLGNHYKYEDWSLAFDAVMKVEGNTVKAQNLEQLTIKFGDIEGNAVELSQKLHQYRVQLLHEDLVNSKQTQIDSYFSHTT
ncbi:hypothetical protein V8E53_008068 [Lactarius tabidus]